MGSLSPRDQENFEKGFSAGVIVGLLAIVVIITVVYLYGTYGHYLTGNEPSTFIWSR